jgi:autotransporter-associated beta strand protein
MHHLTRRPLALVFRCIAAALLVAGIASGEELSWDPANTGLGEDGFWNLSPANLAWDRIAPAERGNVNVAWPAIAADARFDVLSGQTITADEGAPIPVDGMLFTPPSQGEIFFKGNSSDDRLDFGAGPAAFNVLNEELFVNLELPLTAGSLVKDGAGWVRLLSANAITGGTIIRAGTLELNHAQGINAAQPTILQSGGMLVVDAPQKVDLSKVRIDRGGVLWLLNLSVGEDSYELPSGPIAGTVRSQNLGEKEGTLRMSDVSRLSGWFSGFAGSIVAESGIVNVGPDPDEAGFFQSTFNSITGTGGIRVDGDQSVQIFGDSSFRGPTILDGSGTLSVKEFSLPRARLSGTSGVYVNNGVFELEGEPQVDRLNAPVYLSGGTFQFTTGASGNTEEVIPSIELDKASSMVAELSGGSPLYGTLRVNSLARQRGATLNVSGTNLGDAAGTGQAGRILVGNGGELLVNGILPFVSVGTDWATYDTTHGIRALTSGPSDVDGTGPAGVPSVTLDNVRAIAPQSPLSADRHINSLNLSGAQSYNFALGGHRLSLFSGALLNSGANRLISDGQLTTGTVAPTELHIRTASNVLSVTARIQDRVPGADLTLLKSGAGTLALGNEAGADNSFSGGTILNEGTLEALVREASQRPLGPGPVDFRGGVFKLRSTAATSTQHQPGNDVAITGNSSSLPEKLVLMLEAPELSPASSFRLGDLALAAHKTLSVQADTRLGLQFGRLELRGNSQLEVDADVDVKFLEGLDDGGTARSLVKLGDGVVTLAAPAVSSTGLMRIENGRLIASATAAIGNSPIEVGSGWLQLAAPGSVSNTVTVLNGSLDYEVDGAGGNGLVTTSGHPGASQITLGVMVANTGGNTFEIDSGDVLAIQNSNAPNGLLTRGTNLTLTPGAIVAQGTAGLASNGVIANLGTANDLYLGLSSDLSDSVLVGHSGGGTPWRGISSDRTTRRLLSGEITVDTSGGANSFTLQGIDGQSLILGNGTAPGGVRVTSATPSTSHIGGQVTLDDNENSFGNVSFQVGQGGDLRLLQPSAMSNATAVSVGPGGQLTLGAVAAANRPVSLAAGGAIAVDVAGGLAGGGAISQVDGSINRLRAGGALSNSAGTAMATQSLNTVPGSIVRLEADNIAFLDEAVDDASIIVVAGGDRTQNPAVGAKRLSLDANNGAGAVFTNDDAYRKFTSAAPIEVGSHGATFAGSTQGSLTIEAPVVAQGPVRVGYDGLIEGLPRSTFVRFAGPFHAPSLLIEGFSLFNSGPAFAHSDTNVSGDITLNSGVLYLWGDGSAALTDRLTDTTGLVANRVADRIILNRSGVRVEMMLKAPPAPFDINKDRIKVTQPFVIMPNVGLNPDDARNFWVHTVEPKPLGVDIEDITLHEGSVANFEHTFGTNLRAKFKLAGNAQLLGSHPGKPIGILGTVRDGSLPPYDGANAVTLKVFSNSSSPNFSLHGPVERGTVLDLAQGTLAMASGAVVDGEVLMDKTSDRVSILLGEAGAAPVRGEGQILLQQGTVTALANRSANPVVHRVDVPIKVDRTSSFMFPATIAAQLATSGLPTAPTTVHYSDVRLADTAYARLSAPNFGVRLVTDITLENNAAISGAERAIIGAIRGSGTANHTLSADGVFVGKLERTSPANGVNLVVVNTGRLTVDPETMNAFDLNGGTIRVRGSLLAVDSNPGRGTIEAEQVVPGAIELNHGRSGSAWGAGLTINVHSDGSQLTGLVDETSGAERLVNRIDAAIHVDPGKAFSIGARRGAQGTFPGEVYFSNLQVGADARLGLQNQSQFLRLGQVIAGSGVSITTMGATASGPIQRYAIEELRTDPRGIGTITVAPQSELTIGRLIATELTLQGSNSIVVVPANSGTSTVTKLTIAGGINPTGKLDLTNNSAVINYTGTSPADTIRQQIINGRGGSGLGKTWNGQGITSSAAAAAEPESRSVGYAENATMPLGPLTTFRGQSVDSTTVIMAFTRTADANLDGVVNDDDVTIVGATYAPGVANASWANGDFDYNGFVDDDDVTLLGALYNPSAPPVLAPAAESGASVVAVPEPHAVWLLLAGSAGILAFSRMR